MTSKSKVKGIIEAKRKAIFANKAQIRKTALVDADLIADGKTIVAKFKNNNEKQEWIDSEIIPLVEDDNYESWTDNSKDRKNYIHFINNWISLTLDDQDVENLFRHLKLMRKKIKEISQ